MFGIVINRSSKTVTMKVLALLLVAMVLTAVTCIEDDEHHIEARATNQDCYGPPPSETTISIWSYDDGRHRCIKRTGCYNYNDLNAYRSERVCEQSCMPGPGK